MNQVNSIVLLMGYIVNRNWSFPLNQKDHQVTTNKIATWRHQSFNPNHRISYRSLLPIRSQEASRDRAMTNNKWDLMTMIKLVKQPVLTYELFTIIISNFLISFSLVKMKNQNKTKINQNKKKNKNNNNLLCKHKMK